MLAAWSAIGSTTAGWSGVEASPTAWLSLVHGSRQGGSASAELAAASVMCSSGGIGMGCGRGGSCRAGGALAMWGRGSWAAAGGCLAAGASSAAIAGQMRGRKAAASTHTPVIRSRCKQTSGAVTGTWHHASRHAWVHSTLR